MFRKGSIIASKLKGLYLKRIVAKKGGRRGNPEETTFRMTKLAKFPEKQTLIVPKQSFIQNSMDFHTKRAFAKQNFQKIC